MARKKQITPTSNSGAFMPQGQYSPFQIPTLHKYYLPILKADSPSPGQIPPILLLGVKGGVGTSTIANLVDNPNKILDFAQFDNRRQWVSYLPRVILVSNYTYASILALQGVMQQFTDKQQFASAGFTPAVLGVALVDNVNNKVTNTVKKLLEYVTSGVPTWSFKFVPQLVDVAVPEGVGVPANFYRNTESMAALAAN